SRGLIDGIGVQCHAFSTRGEASAITANLNTLAKTGLPIQATELDIDGPADLTQLKDYQKIIPAIWEHEAVEGITLWGYRPGLWRNNEKAYIIEADGTERPAMIWLKAYISGTFVPISAITVSADGGSAAIEEKGGTLQLTATITPSEATFFEADVTWTV